MAVAIVGTPKTAQTATLNPTVAMGTVVANHTLFEMCVQKATQTFPGTPTDNQGDVFTSMGGDMSIPNQAISGDLFYCPQAKGGATTLTIPTTATCLYVAAELSGVAVPAQITGPKGTAGDSRTLPYIDLANCDGQGQCNTAPPVLSPNGGLVVALIAHIVATTYTFTSTGWTHIGSGSALGLWYDAWMINVSVAGQWSANWTVGTPSAGIVLGVAFPAA